MPSHRPACCRICARHETEVGRISWRGKCADCGDARLIENDRALRAKTGPFYVHWRRQHAAAVGGVLLADLPAILEHAERR